MKRFLKYLLPPILFLIISAIAYIVYVGMALRRLG